MTVKHTYKSAARQTNCDRCMSVMQQLRVYHEHIRTTRKIATRWGRFVRTAPSTGTEYRHRVQASTIRVCTALSKIHVWACLHYLAPKMFMQQDSAVGTASRTYSFCFLGFVQNLKLGRTSKVQGRVKLRDKGWPNPCESAQCESVAFVFTLIPL